MPNPGSLFIFKVPKDIFEDLYNNTAKLFKAKI